MDIVGPLPADRRHEFLIVFVDCYSRYTILVLASNHTANTVSDALLRHVVPYFGTPCCLLSDRGREFVGEVWSKITRSLGIQRLLTSPYHPERNSINKRSHRTINNMLRARLLDGTPSRTWVDNIPSIMLALNAMAHEPHGFSASMIATGREPTLPPDLEGDACASPSLDDPASYVEAVKKRLTLTHQQMVPPPAPAATNPYQEGSLIFAMTTPPERTNKLAPRWKGPFMVRRVPNPYQVIYEDGSAWRTIHINHAKQAKLPQSLSKKHGADIPSLVGLQPVSWIQGGPLLLLQCPFGRPAHWRNGVPRHCVATRGHHTQDAGSCLSLCLVRSGHAHWASMSAPLHESRFVVAPAFRWRLQAGSQWDTLLSGTPGTACGLARG